MKLHFRKYGDSPEVIVIVHGLFGMLDNWHNIARKLSETHTVYSVDVRNHGGSPHDEEMNYSVIGEDLKHFLKDHNINRANFIGHSMGGKAVMKLADLYPEIIDRLIVVDIAPKKYRPGHLELFDAMFNLPVADLKSRTEADKALSEKVPEMGVRLFLLKNIERRPEGGFRWKLNLQTIFDHYEEIIDTIELDTPFLGETLFISGDRSGYIRETDHADILRQFPDARFETVENSGHWVHAENPTAFLDTVVQFLG